MKAFYKYFLLALLIVVVFLINDKDARASENVNITIPTEINIIFNEDGTNEVSDFVISNNSELPITVDSVYITEKNGWKMVRDNTEILVDTKQIVFKQEEQCLLAGENQINLTVPENTEKALNLKVGRGAWTTSNASETAFHLEFSYSVGKRLFELELDGYETMSVYNGESVSLPQPEKEGYEFRGWKDSDGNVHAETYTMPVGNAVLTPIWKKIIVCAVFTEGNSTLSFIKAPEDLQVGDTYDNHTITKLYTGFENVTFTSENEVPWYADKVIYDVKNIVVKDEIKPTSTAYWFFYSMECESINVEKLDVSDVTNMKKTFSYCGFSCSEVEIIGVETWDVSKVTNMEHMFSFVGRDCGEVSIDLSSWNVSKVKIMTSMFEGIGYFSSKLSLGNIGKWNVSNVTNMDEMFKFAGYHATYKLDCSKWKVKKVTSYIDFDKLVESKVIEPAWVN